MCTWFIPKISKLDARKKWIASTLHTKGYLRIDEGAQRALQKGKSLLAAGVKSIGGSFNKGDQIKVIGKNNVELAIGLSSFSSNEIMFFFICLSKFSKISIVFLAITASLFSF